MTFKCLTQNGLRQFYKTVFEGHEGYTAFNLLCQLIVHGSTDTNTAWLKNGIICGPHWWKTCTVPWIAVGTFQAANICSRWPLSYIAKYGDQAVSSKKKKKVLWVAISAHAWEVVSQIMNWDCTFQLNAALKYRPEDWQHTIKTAKNVIIILYTRSQSCFSPNH